MPIDRSIRPDIHISKRRIVDNPDDSTNSTIYRFTGYIRNLESFMAELSDTKADTMSINSRNPTTEVVCNRCSMRVGV